jgi:hypothetical protein
MKKKIIATTLLATGVSTYILLRQIFRRKEYGKGY